LQLALVVPLTTCTVRVACDARSPNEQLSDWLGALPVIEQPAVAGLIDQFTPVPPGSGSDKVTPVAVPTPVLDTVIVKPIWSPALTVALSAVLLICKPGQFTVVLAFAVTVGLFVASAVAVFGYVAQLAKTVALVTCTDFEVFAPMSPKLHVRVPLLIAQPAAGGLIDHAIPAPVGRASLSDTDFAVPGPALLTVIVNPMFDPALTDAASAVLVIERFGHCTMIDACAGGTAPLLLAATVAELLYVPQLARTVGLEMWTDAEAPLASDPTVQPRVWLPTAPVIAHVPGPA
jgi:hypothetical protein